MIAASRQMGHAAAYVELSPGSFSEESLAGVDPSGVPWLFVRAEQELAFFDELFAEIEARVKSAEFRRVHGRGHGATLMDGRPELVVELADWLQVHLAPR